MLSLSPRCWCCYYCSLRRIGEREFFFLFFLTRLGERDLFFLATFMVLSSLLHVVFVSVSVVCPGVVSVSSTVARPSPNEKDVIVVVVVIAVVIAVVVSVVVAGMPHDLSLPFSLVLLDFYRKSTNFMDASEFSKNCSTISNNSSLSSLSLSLSLSSVSSFSPCRDESNETKYSYCSVKSSSFDSHGAHWINISSTAIIHNAFFVNLKWFLFLQFPFLMSREQRKDLKIFLAQGQYCIAPLRYAAR